MMTLSIGSHDAIIKAMPSAALPLEQRNRYIFQVMYVQTIAIRGCPALCHSSIVLHFLVRDYFSSTFACARSMHCLGCCLG